MNPVLREALCALSEAFRARDAACLLELFSTTETVTYAGSEAGERATGLTDLHRLFTTLLSRPVAYSFQFDEITFSERGDTVWVLADGCCTETTDAGGTESFPYRLAGVLTGEDGQWRWEMLACSEPTPSAAPSQVLDPEVLLDVGAGVLAPVDVHQTQGIGHDVPAGLGEHHVGPGLPLSDAGFHHH